MTNVLLQLPGIGIGNNPRLRTCHTYVLLDPRLVAIDVRLEHFYESHDKLYLPAWLQLCPATTPIIQRQVEV
jgi:hypothetical protein